MPTNRLLPLDTTFFVGCNYWASHAGTAMWSDWRPEQVESDLKLLAEAGIDVLRVFPLWSDFQPIDSLYTGRGAHKDYRFGEERLPDTEAGRAGVSTLMMERFRQFADIASRHNLKLIVGLVTGWMSGRLFVPPALRGKPILTDHDAIRWQVKFVRYFVKQMKDCPSIVAWDLGNECNEMGTVHSREDAYVWTAALSGAIQSSDPSRPLISGMHSLTPNGNWTMQDQGELTDILTTHPYPFWTPYMDFDPLDTMRPTVHATMESLIYADIGEKPCFAEEMGTMGPMVCGEEVAAAYGRTSMWSQWAHGLSGLLWWCAFDQTRLNHAPYDWVACEGELGLVTEDGRIKPVLQELAGLKQRIAALPFDELPPRHVDGVCILNSGQDHWAVAAGTFMLAKQAGFDIGYRFEDQTLPDAPFYLLPCVTGVSGMPKQQWEALLGKVKAGAALYVSSNDGYMLNFAELTGLTVLNRRRRSSAAEVAVPLAGDAGGDIRLKLPSAFRLEFRNDRAEVLASEADGNPVLVKADFGKGTVYFCSLPVELAMIEQAEVSYMPEEAPYWCMYELVSQGVREQRVLACSQPQLGVTEHPMPGGTQPEARIAVLVNYSPEPHSAVVRIKDGWRVRVCYFGDMTDVQDGSFTCLVPPNDAIVLELQALTGR